MLIISVGMYGKINGHIRIGEIEETPFSVKGELTPWGSKAKLEKGVSMNSIIVKNGYFNTDVVSATLQALLCLVLAICNFAI